MDAVFNVIAVTLGILFAWGAVAPRGQWRSLAAWSVSDPYADEPGGGAYGWRRALSAVGALSLGAILVFSIAADVPPTAVPRAEPGPVEIMWGAPAPHIVNRVVKPAKAAAPDLVEVPIIDFQGFEGGNFPIYLVEIQEFSYLGQFNPGGYIGGLPDIATSAIETADLVVHVRGPILCIPRSAVVIETPESVLIAIYYGLPNGVKGVVLDHAAGCEIDSAVTASVLIPLELNAPIGDRTVVTLAGASIPEVAIAE